MDRSYLSDQRVVAASRSFVCARLLTYESAEEGAMLQRLFRGRDGLENSVFAILDPSGNRQLTRAGRGPSWAFDNAAEMAVTMAKIARRYRGNKNVAIDLPLLADVRRGLNAAAADQQQLVIVCGKNSERKRLEQSLARLAWSDRLIGKFLYARADDDTDWSVIDGDGQLPTTGIVIVQPGAFGTDGKVVATFAKPTEKQLLAAAAAHQPGAVDTRSLRRKGVRAGVKWQTEIPVTDRRGPGGGRRN